MNDVIEKIVEDISYCDFRTEVGVDKARQIIRRAVTTPKVKPSAECGGSTTTNFNKGTWYQSNVSGVWYGDADAAGDLRGVKVDGKYFVAFDDLV